MNIRLGTATEHTQQLSDSLKSYAGIQCCCIGIAMKPLVLPGGWRMKE
jgi:hypothetical protein